MKQFFRIVAFLLSVLVVVSLFSFVCLAKDDCIECSDTRNSGKNDKLIALTFDDGPGKDTKRLLDGLKKRGAHCTFFIVGQYAKIYPATIKQCYEDGHQVANHSYSHPFFSSLSDSDIKSELSKTNEAVYSAIGCKLPPLMVRPPYGDYSQRILNALGVPAFYWSDDSGDWWDGATANSVYQNTIRTAEDGDILLLHDSHSWSVDAALRIVDTLQARGYEFVTLSELFRRRGVTLQAGKIYSCLRANGTNLPTVSKPNIKATPTVDGMEITMSADNGTKIYYTTDGSIPNASSKVYQKPFILTAATKITAVAGYDMNGSRSSLSTVTVPKLRMTNSPVIKIEADGFVTIESKDTVYYTLDNSTPTQESDVYENPFYVEAGTLVSAFAYEGKPDTVKSSTVSMYYSLLGNVFDDIRPDAWFTDAVDSVVSKKIMVGTAPNHFAPSGTVTRAQIVQVLCELCHGKAMAQTSGFADIMAGKWYSDAVIWAEENHIISGYTDGCFHPNDALSREQCTVILQHFAQYCSYFANETLDISNYSDVLSVSGYAKDAFIWAIAAGILNGSDKNTLMPKQTMTRAQLAMIILNYQTHESEWAMRPTLSEEKLRDLSDTIIILLKQKNYQSVQQYVHPTEGLTFSPYGTVTENDISVQSDSLSMFAVSEDIISWGKWDGSGEDILMSFADYYERFIFNADFSNADRITPNRITVCGNTIENITQAYPNCLFVEYVIDSCFGYNDGTDWCTLKLVFTLYESEWFLTGVIHSEWTV